MVSKLTSPIIKFVDNAASDYFVDVNKTENVSSEPSENVKMYAKAFLDGMSKEQKARFKQMIEHGIEAGRNVAEVYGVDPDEFMKAIKELIK